MMTDDAQTSREERCFRLWINSLGVDTYVNNLFEDVRTGWDFLFLFFCLDIQLYEFSFILICPACRWVLLEVLDKISPGSVNWKQATRPPIKMPFRKVENCNQVVSIGKDLNFSLVNVAGNDIVQGNKKLILGKTAPTWKVSAESILSYQSLFSSKNTKLCFIHRFRYCNVLFIFLKKIIGGNR